MSWLVILPLAWVWMSKEWMQTCNVKDAERLRMTWKAGYKFLFSQNRPRKDHWRLDRDVGFRLCILDFIRKEKTYISIGMWIMNKSSVWHCKKKKKMYDFTFQDKDNLPRELKTLKVAFADSMEQVCGFFFGAQMCFCECVCTCVCCTLDL